MSKPYVARTRRAALVGFLDLPESDITVHNIARFSRGYGFEQVDMPMSSFNSAIRFKASSSRGSFFIKIVEKDGRWDEIYENQTRAASRTR